MTILLLIQFEFLLFPFLLWLPWLGHPKLCCIEMERVDVLVPDLRRHGVCVLSCLTLCPPMGCPCHTPLSVGFSRQEIRVVCHFLLQGLFMTQRSNLHLLHWQADFLPLVPSEWSKFFTIESDVSCGFVIYGLHFAEMGSLCTCFLEILFFFLMINEFLNFVKFSFCVYWDDHVVFLLQFVNVVCHTDWLAYVEEPLHPWGKSHLIMVYDPSNVLLDLFANVLLRIFASVFISDIGQ